MFFVCSRCFRPWQPSECCVTPRRVCVCVLVNVEGQRLETKVKTHRILHHSFHLVLPVLQPPICLFEPAFSYGGRTAYSLCTVLSSRDQVLCRRKRQGTRLLMKLAASFTLARSRQQLHQEKTEAAAHPTSPLPLLVQLTKLFSQPRGPGSRREGGAADVRSQGGGRVGAGEGQRGRRVRAAESRPRHPGGLEELRQPGDEGARDGRPLRVRDKVCFVVSWGGGGGLCLLLGWLELVSVSALPHVCSPLLSLGSCFRVERLCPVVSRTYRTSSTQHSFAAWARQRLAAAGPISARLLA